ncbi:MAG TPA: NAD(P)-dependent oxidoreductase [Casimicrobiaceae bacterium]
MPKVYYNSHASDYVYAVIRETLPTGFELVTLDNDDDEERKTKIRDCEVVICAAYRLSATLVAAAAKLKLIHHQGVGYHDTIDIDAVKARRVPLAITPEGTDISVAEHTVMLMLAACRRLTFADAELRAGRFHINALRPVSRELNGMTIGYVGMGRIAQAVAQRLKAFATRGIYFDPFAVLNDETAARLLLHRVLTLDALLREADIVTLHIPLTAETRHLISSATIAAMKRGAILINTARGPIVDEKALAEALQQGHLGAAGPSTVASGKPAPAEQRAAGPSVHTANLIAPMSVLLGSRIVIRLWFDRPRRGNSFVPVERSSARKA